MLRNNNNEDGNGKYEDGKIDHLLCNNQEIINMLIKENTIRRDKSLITIKEMDLISQIERNLQCLIEKCPPKVMKMLLNQMGEIDTTTLTPAITHNQYSQ